MKTIFQSSSYAPELVVARLVRLSPCGSVFCWCELNVNRYDIRQGECLADELPASVRDAARAAGGMWPSYVDWPI